jgi:hypothetical protein
MATVISALSAVTGLCSTFALALFVTSHHERHSTEPRPR